MPPASGIAVAVAPRHKAGAHVQVGPVGGAEDDRRAQATEVERRPDNGAGW